MGDGMVSIFNTSIFTVTAVTLSLAEEKMWEQYHLCNLIEKLHVFSSSNCIMVRFFSFV